MSSTSTDIVRNARDYARIEAAILYLEAHFRDQPGLDDVAREAGLGPHHFQRLFRRWAGISPKRFGQYLTLDYAKAQLEASASILDATYDAGLSGPGPAARPLRHLRGHEPRRLQTTRRGRGYRLGRSSEPLRPLLRRPDGARHLRPRFRRRRCRRGPRRVRDPAGPPPASARTLPPPRPVVARVFGETGDRRGTPLRLAVAGTNFQLKVWEALLRIPPGRVTSYRALAQALGLPRSARAVGGAVAANPISYLIPCHRVIRGTGRISNYEWGPARKRVMLGWEAARFGPTDARLTPQGS